MMVIEGRTLLQGRIQPVALGVEDGVIAAVRRTLRGEERYDFGDRLLLPGGVDVHVHFRDPGFPPKEDFATGTEAAACGGVTTVLDMPNTRPPATTPGALREKREAVARRAHVDFGLYGGLLRAEDVARLAPHAHAFKVYLAESFGRLSPLPEEVPRLVAALRDARRRTTVHAEDPAHLRPREERGLRDHDAARPAAAEEAAIRGLAAAYGGGPLHLAHLSSRAGLAAARGTGFSTEVTPMHLLLDATADLGPRGKVNPPLREPADREALWSAFAAGRIDVLASDHAPHTLEEKADFAAAPPGAPNVETLVPLLLARVRRGLLDLDVLVRAVATRPAALFNLGGKGGLEVGKDADVAVFDPRRTVKVRADALHSRCGWTPFEGWEAVFPEATFLRGLLVARDGRLEADRQGRPLPLEGGPARS